MLFYHILPDFVNGYGRVIKNLQTDKNTKISLSRLCIATIFIIKSEKNLTNIPLYGRIDSRLIIFLIYKPK